MAISSVAKTTGLGYRYHIYKWARRFLKQSIDGLADKPGGGRKPFFSEVAAHGVKMSCERPELSDPSLSMGLLSHSTRSGGTTHRYCTVSIKLAACR